MVLRLIKSFYNKILVMKELVHVACVIAILPITLKMMEVLFPRFVKGVICPYPRRDNFYSCTMNFIV